jgi:hypothetical protein
VLRVLSDEPLERDEVVLGLILATRYVAEHHHRRNLVVLLVCPDEGSLRALIPDEQVLEVLVLKELHRPNEVRP